MGQVVILLDRAVQAADGRCEPAGREAREVVVKELGGRGQAGAQERAAKAKKTSVEAASEAMQLQLAQNALGIMQPQANLPPAQPQMPPPTNGMPPMQ